MEIVQIVPFSIRTMKRTDSIGAFSEIKKDGFRIAVLGIWKAQWNRKAVQNERDTFQRKEN